MKKIPIKNFLLLIFSSLLILLISEIVLRYFIKPIDSGWGWKNSPRRSLSKWANDTGNQLGVRGQKINYNKNDFIILLLGDSQVEAASSPPSLMPEKLLQNYLGEGNNRNVKVFSIASSGWGQDQQLLALEKYYKAFRADLVLAWVTPKNDFWENSFPDRSLTKTAGHIKPTFLLKEKELYGPYYKSGNYYKNSALLQLFFSALQTIKGESLEQLILNQWIEQMPPAHTFHIDKNTSDKRDKNPIQESHYLFCKNIEEYSEKDSMVILLREDFLNSRSHFSPFAINKSERDKYLINITKELFTSMEKLAQSNNSKLIVFYPSRNDYDFIFTKSIRFVKLADNHNYVFPVNLNYESILYEVIPTQTDFFCFTINSDSILSVSNTDRHFNTYGNQLVINNVAEYIVKTFFNDNTTDYLQ